MSKRIMVRDGSGAGVGWRHLIENKHWDKFEYENWMLKTFKQVILNNKDAVYRFETSKILNKIMNNFLQERG